ncbi:uncharacterized protein [Primulina eburnea]|uniref:uncharacterized protein isoform X3 n=1 Tax=Primulina eburnea TaxID=1245227 RepID=UPI003C6C0B38
MVFITEEMINQLQSHVEKRNIDHRHESETLVRYFKSKGWECFGCTSNGLLLFIQLQPIDTHMYTSIRESQLVGISGYSKEPSATKKYGRYIGTCIKISDMTGLKLSALSKIKMQTMMNVQISKQLHPKKDPMLLKFLIKKQWKELL